MKRPALPYLLLLPLLAVLLFGNCGGVRSTLIGMGPIRREKLRASVVRQQAGRAAARQHLSGQSRRAAYRRLEQAAQATADSLLRGDERRKFSNRRRKLERQLLLDYRPNGSPRGFGE